MFCSQESIKTKAGFLKALSVCGDLVAFVNLGIRTAVGTSHYYYLPTTDQLVWVPAEEQTFLRNEISACSPIPVSPLLVPDLRSLVDSVAGAFAG